MSTNREQININIASLKYDPKTVMVFNGTKIDNDVDSRPKDTFDESSYTITTREKASYEADFDIAVPNAFNDITYPGALLIASNELLDGKPQELAAEKSEINFTIDLPGSSDISFTAVPTYKNVQIGINELLAKWFEKQGGQWSIPANFQYSSSLVYDEHELSLKFGCDVTYMKQKLDINFSRTSTEKKSLYIVRFKQIFYTLSSERPAKPANIFSEATTWEDLQRVGVSNEHPPLFVKNVQYGRQIFLKFESNLSTTELETVVKGTFSQGGVDVNGSASIKNKEKLEQINVSIVALGGSPTIYKDLKMNSVEDAKTINKIIWENTILSKTNPAAPLNYYTVYLKDGVSAGVHGKTEYIAEKTERFTNGELRLVHNGWYVAKFTISWDEIHYENGEKKTQNITWGGNGQDRTAPFSTTIPLKANTRKINIKAEGCTGSWLPGEWWRISGDKHDLPLVPIRTVTIDGTTGYQTFVMDPDS
ncbi:MAG: thiol-activated cytolysin family protein [Methanoregula sp.]|jgi:thiol-activated cytolysin|nr:thiol-activated cytolysin family protein [Methanoregula sp.]